MPMYRAVSCGKEVSRIGQLKSAIYARMEEVSFRSGAAVAGAVLIAAGVVITLAVVPGGPGGAAGREPARRRAAAWHRGRLERHVQRVGEQLAPGRRAAAAAELTGEQAPVLVLLAGGRPQVVELAAEQEGHPLQGRAQQVVPLVGQGQALSLIHI